MAYEQLHKLKQVFVLHILAKNLFEKNHILTTVYKYNLYSTNKFNCLFKINIWKIKKMNYSNSVFINIE